MYSQQMQNYFLSMDQPQQSQSQQIDICIDHHHHHDDQIPTQLGITEKEPIVQSNQTSITNGPSQSFNTNTSTITPTSTTTTTSVPTKKRAKRACLNCRSSKVACDQERPCTRCTKHGIEETCLDIPRKPKVVKKIKKDQNPNQASSLSTQPINFPTGIPTHLITHSQIQPQPSAMVTQPQQLQNMIEALQYQQMLQQQYQLVQQQQFAKKDRTPTTSNIPTQPSFLGNQDILATMTPSNQTNQTTITNNGNSLVNIPASPQQSLISPIFLNNPPKSPMFKFGCDIKDNDLNININTPSPLNYQQPSPMVNYFFNNNSNDQIKLIRSTDMNHDNFFLPNTPQLGNDKLTTTALNTVTTINNSNSNSSNNSTTHSPSHSIPSSPSSAFSTPVLLGSMPDSSPTSPPRENISINTIGANNLNEQPNSIKLEEIHQTPQQTQSSQQPNISSTIQSVFENVFVNLSSLINTTQSFQEPIGMTNSPFGYCIKSPFQNVDGSPNTNNNSNNNNNDQQPSSNQDLSIIPSTNNSKLTQLNNFPSTMIPPVNYHSTHPIQSFLPEVLITEFKKIHQSLETITSLLQFPSVPRPLYAPSPKSALVPGNLWTPCLESISLLLPFSKWKFPSRSLIDVNESFCKLLGYQSIAQFYSLNPNPIWDETVHTQIIPFTNRYAMEAVFKGLKKFQRPCVFRKINNRFLSVNILVEFDDHYTTFKTTVLQQYSEVSEDLSGEYIIREFRGKQACLELDDTPF